MELINRLGIASQINKVYEIHPEWKSDCRREARAITKDHSSAKDWIGLLCLSSCSELVSAWNVGFREAKNTPRNFGFKDEEFIIPSHVSMMHPYGCELDVDENQLFLEVDEIASDSESNLSEESAGETTNDQ